MATRTSARSAANAARAVAGNSSRPISIDTCNARVDSAIGRPLSATSLYGRSWPFCNLRKTALLVHTVQGSERRDLAKNHWRRIPRHPTLRAGPERQVAAASPRWSRVWNVDRRPWRATVARTHRGTVPAGHQNAFWRIRASGTCYGRPERVAGVLTRPDWPPSSRKTSPHSSKPGEHCGGVFLASIHELEEEHGAGGL